MNGNWDCGVKSELGMELLPPPPVAVDDVDEVPSWRLAAADDADFEELAEDLLRLLRRHPPPTGTLRSAPPRVQ